MGEIFKGLNIGMTYVLAMTAGDFSHRIYKYMNASWVCDAGEAIRTEHFSTMRRMMPAGFLSCIIFSEAAVFFRNFNWRSEDAQIAREFSTQFTWIAWIMWVTVTGIICVMIITAMSVAAQADCMYMIIPDQISLFLIPTGIIFNISAACAEVISGGKLPEPAKMGEMRIPFSVFSDVIKKACLISISGMIAGFLMLLVCRVISRILSGGEALGMGDVKLVCACGAVLGVEGVLIMLFISSASSSVFSLAAAAFRKRKLNEYHPFGPWLYMATSVCLIFG